MKRRIVLAFSTLFFCLSTADAQEQISLKMSNYGGIHSALANPAWNVGSSLRWDLHIVSAGLFTENNYAYIDKATLPKIIRHAGDIGPAPGVSTNETRRNSTLQYNFFDTRRKKFGTTQAFVMGPSIVINRNGQSFGFYIAAREAMSANRISSTLNYYHLQSLNFGDSFGVKKFKFGMLNWKEAGLNYGRTLFEDSKTALAVGGTFKIIAANDAAFFKNNQNTTLTKQDGFIHFNGADADFGLATSMNVADDFSTTGYSNQVLGWGAAIDLGATYTIKKSGYREEGYLWKFGASLLDFGKVSIKKAASKHKISAENTFNIVYNEFTNDESVQDGFSNISLQSLGDSLISQTGNRFGMWMPAGIALQAELSVTENIFINAQAVRRLRFFSAQVERNNIIAITPRFEHRWFEAAMPLVLFNDRDLRFGTSIRLAFITIGSDNLPSLIIPSKFTGSDIYVALKINADMINRVKSAKSKGSGGKRRKSCNGWYSTRI